MVSSEEAVRGSVWGMLGKKVGQLQLLAVVRAAAVSGKPRWDFSLWFRHRPKSPEVPRFADCLRSQTWNWPVK